MDNFSNFSSEVKAMFSKLKLSAKIFVVLFGLIVIYWLLAAIFG